MLKNFNLKIERIIAIFDDFMIIKKPSKTIFTLQIHCFSAKNGKMSKNTRKTRQLEINLEKSRNQSINTRTPGPSKNVSKTRIFR